MKKGPFKLGREERRYRTPENTPIFRKKLDSGILGDDLNNNSGTFSIGYIDESSNGDDTKDSYTKTPGIYISQDGRIGIGTTDISSDSE